MFAGVALALSACGNKQEHMQMPPPEVAVQTVDSAAVPLDLTYTARTVGSREVEVRARVGGILLKRRYEEGSRVREGQTLFQIDPEPIRARVASARAEVSVAKARLDEAHRQRDRVLPLFEKNAVSQSRRDEAVSAFEVAQANLTAAEASLKTAELDLEYSDVRAPISGLTSREVLSEGSLVSTDQNSSLLTRIVQIDPLYVEFSVPEAEAVLLRNSLAPANKQPAPVVKLLLDDGSEYPDAAKLTFVDNAVDVQTGTVRVRAVLGNKSAQLIPGQFVRARVEGVTLANVVSIPRKAVMSSAQGSFVWIVGADDKVEMRPVQVGRGMRNDVVITSGLAAGDRYVVDGVLKVQPGIQVSAVSVDAATRQAEGEAAPAPAQKES
ncbi:MAG TPA: efflux RND transporter periplasmic adaptor subunit [Povalibacter sp.]|uniref:efflux RND transporter periplasmic adaptor subunit n=1 Tax=Povalibacter sp. TaxID=1962978 RepID=UPI002C16AC98|nr:efflux RND transporter periplasmic adaptor subunit [Povalibacter sp.]HMN46080.1 efflux RND transporter periplasmic adaptor subunit [Povalibacter sp.]